MVQSLARGIDLSQHNGTPNFDKIKASGVEFVMIRMGYGGDSVSQDDPQFERSVAECERVGLPWGAYLYSYALNIQDAVSERNHMLRLLKGKNPKYPVYLDMEDADGYKAKHGMPSNSILVDICDTVLSGLETAGYYAGLYAGLSWLEHQLAGTKLDKYDKWVAQWSSKCTYEKPFGMWQNSDAGAVDGVVGRVDTNLAYYNFPQIIEGMHAPAPSTEVAPKVEQAPVPVAAAPVEPTTTTTTVAPTTTTTTTVKPKSIDELAHEVIAGTLGNGEQRKQALGAQYDAVQARVAELLAPPKPAKSIDELAHEVIAGTLGNGDQRRAVLGAQYNAVQARVAELMAPPKPAKSIDELAHEVIAGKLGSGEQRKQALGAQYDAVQARVAQLINPQPAQKSISELAHEVIAGKLGSGDARKAALGAQYDAVQAEVTRLMKG